MTALNEAWRWYNETRDLVRMLRRLDDRYWEHVPWDNLLERDDTFRLVEGETVVGEADFSLERLDDLAIIVLFSAFESIVRDRVLAEITAEAESIRHETLRLAAREAISEIEEGSFFRVLEPFKALDASLVEEVSQVRRYWNWVAHGRRGHPRETVDPGMAYRRLARFLDTLSSTSQPTDVIV